MDNLPTSDSAAPAAGRTLRVAVSCGGTGGHMFPGLAVAAELRRRGHRVAVILSGRAVEADRAKADLPEGAEPILVPVDPVSPRRPKSLLKLWGACRAAKRELRAFRPDALLAMGSYTSIAPVFAARSLGVPVVLHEANAIPGAAVAHLARFAATVCVCFPDMEGFFPRRVRLADTGLPLRAEFAKGIGGSKADPAKLSLLVMGGSQGARDLNRGVVRAFSEALAAGGRAGLPDRIVHLAGTRNEDEVRALWDASGLREAGVEVEVVGFEHDMARRYAEANLCVSRAGASSCFELALAGLPAILVPLPGLARDHQTRNADSMLLRGAAQTFPQKDLLDAEGRKRFVADVAFLGGRIDAKCVPGVLPGIAGTAVADLRAAALEAARPDAAALVADEVERAGSGR